MDENAGLIALTKNGNIVMMKRSAGECLTERTIYEETERTSDKIR